MAALHGYIQGTQLVGTVLAAGSLHSIGDQGYPMGEEPEGQIDAGILHMETVVDQLGRDSAVLHGGRNGPWLTVVDAVHGVENMCEYAGAGIEGTAGLVVVGITMADRRHNTGSGQAGYGLVAVIALGGQRHLAYATVGGLQETVENSGFRVAQALGIVRPLTGEGDERPLQVGTQYVGSGVHDPPDRAQIGTHRVDRIGDQTEHLPGGSMDHMAGPGCANGLVTVIEGVNPAAVRVDVDEPRGEDEAGRIDELHTVRIHVMVIGFSLEGGWQAGQASSSQCGFQAFSTLSDLFNPAFQGQNPAIFPDASGVYQSCAGQDKGMGRSIQG